MLKHDLHPPPPIPWLRAGDRQQIEEHHPSKGLDFNPFGTEGGNDHGSRHSRCEKLLKMPDDHDTRRDMNNPSRERGGQFLHNYISGRLLFHHEELHIRTPRVLLNGQI